MAESMLVEILKEDGRELINNLALGKVPIAAAWWLKPTPESNGIVAEWQFFLASALVDEQGPKALYQKVHDALWAAQGGDPMLARFSIGKITVVGVNSPMAVDVFKIIKRYRGKPPIYVSNCSLGSIEAEELYIDYVATLPAPWQQVVLKAPAVLDEPLSPQESQAMSQIVGSGVNPARAGSLVWKKHEEISSKSQIDAGTIVNARPIGVDDDPDPLLLFALPDGRQGITRKSNTEPVPTPG